MLSTFRTLRCTKRLWYASRSAANKPPVPPQSPEKNELEDEKRKALKKKILSMLSSVSDGAYQSRENITTPEPSPEESKLSIEKSEAVEKVTERQVDEVVCSQKVPVEDVTVTESVPEIPEPIHSALTERLKTLTDQKKLSHLNLQENIKNALHGVVIDKSSSDGKTDFFASPAGRRKMPMQQNRLQTVTEVDIFSLDPPHTFTVDDASTNVVESAHTSTWKKLEENELKSSLYFAPTDAFEEMIMWTEQGLHWKFPIDNEIDIAAEENVGFDKHVFLEQQLEGFPEKGPIRHFMELVVVGLSKNPYITAERKTENIEWFRNYFEQKKDILEEVGLSHKN